MATREIIQVARLAREENTLRFKQLGTLERHDVSPETVEKVLVRLTPHPAKHIVADVITPATVYRCIEGQTLIDYRTFLDDIAPGGLENFRRFVAAVTESLATTDPATAEFASGKPPEAFSTHEEVAAYDAYLQGRETVLPRGSAAGTQTKADADIEKVWAEHAAQLRQEAASDSRVDPRLAGYALVVLGLFIGMGGMFLLMQLLMNDQTNSNPASAGLIGILALCAFIGVVFMLSGVYMLRKAQQLTEDS